MRNRLAPWFHVFMANAPFTTQGPKSRRRTRRDLPNGQVRRWDKRPGNYTPNIMRATRLAQLQALDYKDLETTTGGW